MNPFGMTEAGQAGQAKIDETIFIRKQLTEPSLNTCLTAFSHK